jgi:E3 ubiquitin-protein ligase EDD1
MCVQEEMERVDEEDWLLQDVIFVEDSRNIPVGKVLKVTEIPTHFFLI